MSPMILGGTLLGIVLGGLSYIGVYRATVRFKQKRYQKIIKKAFKEVLIVRKIG